MKPNDGKELRSSLELQSTEELISILRNRDEDEWRPEVFEMVAAILVTRGVSPEAVSALGPEGVDVLESQPLATIARFVSPTEAHAARLALEAGGISAWVADESLGTAYGFGVGVRLQVRAEDQSASLELLETKPTAGDVPAEFAEPPCPSCGSSSVGLVAEVIESAPAFLPSSRHPRQWRYDCASCGHRWASEAD